jgi:hypothetical protein
MPALGRLPLSMAFDWLRRPIGSSSPYSHGMVRIIDDFHEPPGARSFCSTDGTVVVNDIDLAEVPQLLGWLGYHIHRDSLAA